MVELISCLVLSDVELSLEFIELFFTLRLTGISLPSESLAFAIACRPKIGAGAAEFTS